MRRRKRNERNEIYSVTAGCDRCKGRFYNSICGGEFGIKVYFKAAGLDELVKIAFGYNFKDEALYYSAEDAKECCNAVKQRFITEDAINSIID